MGKRTAVGEITVEYLERFPGSPSRTLALKLAHEHPHLFTEDSARSAVRYYRGAIGNKSRNTLATTEHVKEHGEAGENPFSDLPDPISGWEELGIRKVRCKKAGVIADLHFPFYDRRATETALMYLKDAGIDALVILGDLVDFFSLSRWDKDPSITRLRDEYEGTKQFLEVLRREFEGVQIIWKAGNHEERWQRYMWAKAPVIADLPQMTDFETLFGLKRLRIKYSPRTERVQIDRISLIHGHEFWGSISSAVNAARGLYLKAKSTAMCGHLHHSSQHTETNLKGRTVACWSVGALCQLHPEYAPINRWNLGFAMIDKEADSVYSAVHNHKIIGGEVV